MCVRDEKENNVCARGKGEERESEEKEETEWKKRRERNRGNQLKERWRNDF
jgi:hypothetical protein